MKKGEKNSAPAGDRTRASRVAVGRGPPRPRFSLICLLFVVGKIMGEKQTRRIDCDKSRNSLFSRAKTVRLVQVWFSTYFLIIF